MAAPDAPLVAADGTPLKRKLEQAMRVSRLRAFGLVAPLLAFILAVLIIPIIVFMSQGAYNPVYAELMPKSAEAIRAWDGTSPVTEEMAEAMVRALKPGGRLVLVEYRGEDPSIPIKRLHKMTEKQARMEMQAVGLEWESTGDFLPQQHFMIFRRPE